MMNQELLLYNIPEQQQQLEKPRIDARLASNNSVSTSSSTPETCKKTSSRQGSFLFRRRKSSELELQKARLIINPTDASGSHSTQWLAQPCHLTQELDTASPIWVVKFNSSGKFVAAAGQSGVLFIWEIGNTSSTELLTNQRVYTGHSSAIVDLAWSDDNYIITASLDGTARLWHLEEQSELQAFQHGRGAAVTSVAFLSANTILSGCTDKKLRVWDVPSGRVTDFSALSHPITAVAISLKGGICTAGLSNGEVCVFKLSGLAYYTTITCRNAHGTYKTGRKVTGILFCQNESQLLVATNDSRMRLYSLKDYSLLQKFKGNVNETKLLRPSVDLSGEFVTCGSENGSVYLWKKMLLSNTSNTTSRRKSILSKSNSNSTYEKFALPSCSSAASPLSIVTTVNFVPVNNTTINSTNESSSNNEAVPSLMLVGGDDGILRVVSQQSVCE